MDLSPSDRKSEVETSQGSSDTSNKICWIFSQVTTCNETGVHHVTVEWKRVCMEWRRKWETLILQQSSSIVKAFSSLIFRMGNAQSILLTITCRWKKLRLHIGTVEKTNLFEMWSSVMTTPSAILHNEMHSIVYDHPHYSPKLIPCNAYTKKVWPNIKSRGKQMETADWYGIKCL